MIPSILPGYNEEMATDATQQPSHWSVWAAKKVDAGLYALLTEF